MGNPHPIIEILDRSYEDLAAEVTANQKTDHVDVRLRSLLTSEASATMRLRGGFITQLALRSETRGEMVEILHCQKDLSVRKLQATHAMSPVGPSEGLGGQHGPMRWLDHIVYDGRPVLAEEGPELNAIVKGGRGMPVACRSVLLRDNSAVIATTLHARDAAVDTSVGEHFYFAMPAGTTRDVRINNHPIDRLIGAGAADKVASGKAQFWPEPERKLRVELADRAFTLDTGVGAMDGVEGAASGGWLLWQRPGTPSICIEPVAGFTPENPNGLHMPVGSYVGFGTRILDVV